MEPARHLQVRSVWASNADFEFSLISSILPRFPFVAFDTKFPGFLDQRPDRLSLDSLSEEERYALVKLKVDGLHLIQLGLTLFDSAGNIPDLGTGGRVGFVWEINFREFDVRPHPHVPRSIELLHSNGVPLEHFPFFGIDARHIAHLLINSGLVAPFLRGVSPKWIAFHGSYDFAFLVKALGNGRPLPATLGEFIFVVHSVFGSLVDVKHLMSLCKGLYGGLERVASSLKVSRPVGSAHQAGSDSSLTAEVFLKMRDEFFGGNFGEINRHQGLIFGLQVA